MFKKFKDSELFIGRVQAHPRVEFIVNSGSSNTVYYNRRVETGLKSGYEYLSNIVNPVVTSLELFSIDFSKDTGGPKNAGYTLNLNSQSQEPFFYYEAKNLNGLSWPSSNGYGENLKSHGPAPRFQNHFVPIMDSTTKAIGWSNDQYNNVNAASVYSSSAEYVISGTEDVVFECLVYNRGGSRSWLGSGNTSTPGQGTWYLFDSSNFGLNIVSVSSGTLQSGISRSLQGTWMHLLQFFDRDENSATYSIRNYVNGKNYSNKNGFQFLSQSFGNGATFGIGNLRGSTLAVPDTAAPVSPDSGLFSFAGMWKKENWLPGGADNATVADQVASDRFNSIFGLKAQSIIGEEFPAYSDRNSAHGSIEWFIPEENKRIIMGAGEHWPRLSQFNSDNGVYRAILSHPSRTEETHLSIEMSNAFSNNWVHSDVVINKTLDFSSSIFPSVHSYIQFVANTSSVAHEVYASHLSAVSGSIYCASFFAKKDDGDKDYSYIRFNPSITDILAFFDYSGSVWVSGSDFVYSSGSEDWGNGWVRNYVSFGCKTTTTNTSSTYHGFSNGTSSLSDTIWVGDASTPNGYMNCVNMETYNHWDLNNIKPSHFLNSRNFASAYVSDNIQFDLSDDTFNAGASSIETVFSLPYISTDNARIFTIEDDSGDDVRVIPRRQSELTASTTFATDISASVSNLNDGNLHTVELQLLSGSQKLILDGDEVASGASVSPSNLGSGSILYIGSDPDATNLRLHGAIQKITISKASS